MVKTLHTVYIIAKMRDYVKLIVSKSSKSKMTIVRVRSVANNNDFEEIIRTLFRTQINLKI